MRGIHNEKWRLFASAYVKLANATKAAIEAGYSPKSAAYTGCMLLRKPEVLQFIESFRIRRDVHADITYANLINLADASLKQLQEALNDTNLEFREKMMAFENARRCNETLAQVEGLCQKTLPKPIDDAKQTLQLLAQKLRQPVALSSSQPPVQASEGSAA